MTTYVYIQTEPSLWTVGFYTPAGKWEPDSDHDSPSKAAERVHCLNGGDDQHQITRLRKATQKMVQAADNMALTNGITGELLSATEAARTILRGN